MGKTTADRPKTGLLSQVALQILLSLVETSRHGYGIKQDIEERTGGVMRLGSGTLYETIQRLESLSFIDERLPPPAEARDGRKRRFYRLTQEGRRALQRELVRMDQVLVYARDKKLLPDSR